MSGEGNEALRGTVMGSEIRVSCLNDPWGGFTVEGISREGSQSESVFRGIAKQSIFSHMNPCLMCKKQIN